jgi:hypothetical protein
VEENNTLEYSGATPSPDGKRRRGPVRRVAAVCGWCSSASAVGYLLHGLVVAGVALGAVGLVVGAIALLRLVLLGDSDPRSPFVRFMLLVCVLTGRPPGDYLPPEPRQR